MARSQDYDTTRCLKNTDEIKDGYVHVHDIVKKDEERTYVLRWTIRDYMRLSFGVHYNAHHIRIGKTLHRLRIVKQATRIRTFPTIRKLIFVFLGLTPSPADAQVEITILLDDEEIQSTPQVRDAFPYLNHRKCYSCFEEPPQFISLAYNPTVICRITIQRADVEVHIEKSSLILDNLRDLFLDGKFSDITIHVGGVEFRAHSAILAARSPVFDAMLRHEMKEKTERTLDILDFGAESFRELLMYLYTGRANLLSVDSALPLLHLADKYCVQELKSDLEEFLRCNISIPSVLSILVSADMCSAQSLKNEAIEFILYNLRKVMEMSEWKTFRSRLDLVDEIMHLFSDSYETDY